MYKNYIFDFDGTLFDTLPSYANAYLEMASQHDFPDTYEEVLGWFSKYGTGYAIRKHDWHCKFSEAAHILRPLKEKHAMEAAKPFDGAEALLNAIRSKGGRIFLFSDNYYDFVEKMVEKYGLGKYFEAILCCSGGERKFKLKPDPEGLVYLAEQYHLFLGETVCVGDRGSDFEAARAAGMDCIYIDLYGNEDQLEPKYRVHRLSEIIDLL